MEEKEQRKLGKNLLKELQHRNGLGAERLYNCCVDLIIANPRWNLRALIEDGSEAHNISQVVYLESAVASMGLLCRLQRSFSRVLWSLFILLAGVGSLCMVLLMLWWRIQAKEQEEKAVYAMVEQIIDMLKEQHEFAQNEDTTEQSGLAVQHVRDQLLPPARRKAMQKIWHKAVKFIEANESRVRLETQVIEGEEFAVWRWIQAVPNGGKVWQGQAFGEHNDNNPSTAIYSPTPCLKIRNMFDKEVESEEGWEESVKDALLEKCQDIKSLVHIYVDTKSKEGCVYVKCNSKEAAGKVRLALHGWWFDGRLVTVKHLKVEHYHNRWPEAKFAWRPLQPSTNQMRSLAQPYYRSSLEMT
ncbi:inner nuclear membrane protein Man1-like [Babylonia areolata]|uniref:inner nuclear membrane protein Man1-like n=1 Tax=Babylonia areolata TaxID=304850 RepID=UPI003FD24BD0